MNDIDELLRRHRPALARQLRDDFTNTVITTLKERPAPRIHSLKDFFANFGWIPKVAIATLAIATLVGGVGFYATRQHTTPSPDPGGQARSNPEQPAKPEQPKPPVPQEEQAPQPKVYHSDRGRFSLKYPADWLAYSWEEKAGDRYEVGTHNNAIQLRFQVADEATHNIENFGVNMEIRDIAPEETPYPTYPNGTIVKRLANDIEIWQDKRQQTWYGGTKSENNCPSLRIASYGAFGYKLKNGKYLTLHASFCWAERMTTTKTYEQQVQSDEFKKLFDMLESITQD